MAIQFNNEKRFVIPRWRTLSETLRIGELRNHEFNHYPNNNEGFLTERVREWKLNKTFAYAADLISAAIALEINDNSDVIQAARYVYDSERESDKAIHESARRLLNISAPQTEIRRSNASLPHLDDIYLQIRFYKHRIHDNPRNPINWIEIARLYSLIGLNEKAERSIVIALSIAPHNRFVTRSAVSFFVHINDIGKAHRALKNNQYTPHDPWLLSTEISIADLRKKTSRNIKKGKSILSDNIYESFNVTELSSVIGTLELNSGSHKKSKKLFEQSLLSPTDNTLAQAQWASSKDDRIVVEDNLLTIEYSFEANALRAYKEYNWDQALSSGNGWFHDQFVSPLPAIFVSYILAAIKEDYWNAIEICKSGLITHHDDNGILNNIAYSYALLNDVETAAKYLNRIDTNRMSEKSLIINLATCGLIYFRSGELRQGREFYSKSIEASRRYKDQELTILALANLLREEMRCNSDQASSAYNELKMEYEKHSTERLFFVDRICEAYISEVQTGKYSK